MTYSPLGSAVISFQKRYDPSIASFFVLVRFLMLLSLLTCMIYSYLLISHLLVQGLDFKTKCINGNLNCFLLYSSFKHSETLAYIVTIGVSLIASSICNIYLLAFYDRQKLVYNSIMNEEGTSKLSRILFSSPFWDGQTPTHITDQRRYTQHRLMNQLQDQEVQKKIRFRTRMQKVCLIIRRVISVIINVSLMGGSGIAIYYVSIYESQINLYFEENHKWMLYFGGQIPNLTLILLNFLVPKMTNYLISFESWDYKSTQINNEIWRNFFLSQFNIVIYFLIQIDMVVPQDLIPSLNGVVQFEDKVYPCPEVQLSFGLIKVVFIELIKEVIYHPMIYLLNRLRIYFCPKAQQLSNKLPIEISDVSSNNS